MINYPKDQSEEPPNSTFIWDNFVAHMLIWSTMGVFETICTFQQTVISPSPLSVRYQFEHAVYLSHVRTYVKRFFSLNYISLFQGCFTDTVTIYIKELNLRAMWLKGCVLTKIKCNTYVDRTAENTMLPVSFFMMFSSAIEFDCIYDICNCCIRSTLFYYIVLSLLVEICKCIRPVVSKRNEY